MKELCLFAGLWTLLIIGLSAICAIHGDPWEPWRVLWGISIGIIAGGLVCLPWGQDEARDADAGEPTGEVR